MRRGIVRAVKAAALSSALAAWPRPLPATALAGLFVAPVRAVHPHPPTHSENNNMTSPQQNPAQPLEAPEGPRPGPETEPPLRFEDLPQDLRRECLFRALDGPTESEDGDTSEDGEESEDDNTSEDGEESEDGEVTFISNTDYTSLSTVGNSLPLVLSVSINLSCTSLPPQTYYCL
jgi:hypothetical protein